MGLMESSEDNKTKKVVLRPDQVVVINIILHQRHQEPRGQRDQAVGVMLDLIIIIDVIFDNISIVSSREDNDTRQMAVGPALVVVLDIFFGDVGVGRNHEESETKQMAAMPDLVLIYHFPTVARREKKMDPLTEETEE